MPANRARGDLVEYLKAGVLGTRWPDGGLLTGVTSRTARMIAEHLADGPLQLRADPLSPHDAEEQLRPHLGRIYEAGEQTSELAMDERVLELHSVTMAALDEALELLGVRR